MRYNRGMRKSREEIQQMFNAVKDKVKVGGYYAHYKHPGEKRYRVASIGLMEDTWEPSVTYEHLDSGTKTVRTLSNFLVEVEVEGKKMKRFTLLK